MPSTEELIQTLKKVPLFSRLERPQLRRLVPLVKEVSYSPRQTVCAQGEAGARYYIIWSGSVRVTRVDPEGRAVEVKQLREGDAFGETSLLLGDLRDATVETIGETVFLCIDREDFEPLLSKYPDIERALQMRPDVAERRRYLRLRFAWLEAGEIPVKIVHRHIFTLWERVGLFLFFVVVLGLMGVLLIVTGHGFLRNLIGFLMILGMIGLFLVIGYFYWDWRNDIYIITNRRVAHRERPGIAGERFSAAPLEAIQDIQVVQEGPLARLFNFGDLIIETAGAAGQVVFRNIIQPKAIQQAIFLQQERALSLARVQEREAIRKAVRRHFLLEGEEGEISLPPAPPPAPAPRGCLALLRAPWRFLFTPSWHREGLTVTWRRHWIAILEAIWLPLAIGSVLTVVILLLAQWTGGKVPPSLVLLYAAVMFIDIICFLWRFEDCQNDYLQVTATRLIQVDQLPLFLREQRREANLEQVTNVRFKQGLLGKILNYGDVFVETAAPVGTFHFQRIARPQEVQREIFAHKDAARQRRYAEEARQRRREMLEWLSAYDELRPRPDSPKGGSS